MSQPITSATHTLATQATLIEQGVDKDRAYAYVCGVVQNMSMIRNITVIFGGMPPDLLIHSLSVMAGSLRALSGLTDKQIDLVTEAALRDMDETAHLMDPAPPKGQHN